MVKINDIDRTSTFAWSQDVIPLLATGTVAGAVDANFNSSSSLELWNIFSPTDKDEPVFSASVENRFYGLEWSKPFEGRPKGLLAGAFENGVVEFWDADILIKTKDLSKASVHKSTKHSGAVKTLQFNPNQNHILVTGGSKGEIFIWDTKTFSDPFTPGKAMTPMDEINSVAWNQSVSHIFASTSNGGYTSIWDLKSKREVLHLSYNGQLGRAEFSSVAWHPTQSTKLIVASENDNCPLILTYDLRNANEPEKILQGHKKGVLSLDWCKQDPELLISSGKDNSTILWNPITGEKLGEYPTTANWAFQTRFAPSSPDIFGTASFDGKIIIQSLQDTSPPVSTKVTANNDDEFWNKISTTDTQQPTFVKQQAPRWLKNPSSVSFGFGSKLVKITSDSSGKSIIDISQFVNNSNLQNSTDKLTKALNEDDFKPIIESKLEDDLLKDSDKADWNLLKKLSTEGKDQLFSNAISDSAIEQPKAEAKESNGEAEVATNEDGAEDSFFDKLSVNGKLNEEVDSAFVPSGKFKIINKDAPKESQKLVKSILTNNIEEAVSQCLKDGKLVEALVLALDASNDIKSKVKNEFFKQNNDELSRIIYSASSKNVLDIVSNADVEDWKEIAASISAFSIDTNDFNSKIVELGDRILEADPNQRDNAILCYLAGNALDKVGSIWLKELPSLEAELLKSEKHTNIATPSDARFEALNSFIEKLSAYRSISKISDVLSGPAVEPISKAILEYSNLLASFGLFDLANNFLNLLPSDFEGLKLEKDRISKALGLTSKRSTTRNTGASSTARDPYNRTREASKYAASPSLNSAPTAATAPYQPKTFVPAPVNKPPVPVANNVPAPATNNIYSRQPSVPAVSNPYAPSAAPVNNPYSNPYKPAAPAAAPAPGATFVSPPPPAPAKNKYKEETDGWNDLPETFKKTTAPPRRAAASAVASPSPAPSPFVAPQPPTALPSKRVPSVSQTAPPPPKGLSRTNSKANLPDSNPVNNLTSPRLNNAAVNTRYAPPPVPAANSFGTSTPPQAHATLSRPLTPKNPYAPGASATPPAAKNPYAPAVPAPPSLTGVAPPPSQQFAAPASQFSPGLSQAPPPPKNPYAPPPAAQSRSNVPQGPGSGLPTPKLGGIAPPPAASNGFQGSSFPPPPPAPAGTSAAAAQASGNFPPPPPLGPSVSQAAEPEPETKPRHPNGDRSHIPADWLPIYETMNGKLEELKPKIPEKYQKHGQHMEVRLNALFDALNNEDLSTEAVENLKKISQSLDAQEYETAAALNIEFSTTHSEEVGIWHTGVKHLISMSEAL
ncbi:hypothetical protein HYPBUDRAFT_152434 [Hyphopichia burtonii NRRL Y-1933]|uniref:Protein transport protein SEC31 n=1 Tax=Hyphopichia burtonii NRRL Y-1933 TaxID=984485 RepID=A0A1E4RJS2_9ASCO|nr:hypothetical protein HYPBUDRAFT_152434 [Hyphopichia burtonii NRRL Y-1933]ODV67524.1 hypothetical protein HYPBUDRAFT_152434 [Hyphopichia burtonii NRRL Y-1933]